MGIFEKYSKRNIITALLAILLITFFSFFPCVHNNILHWDDPAHLTNNLHIRQLSIKNLIAIFSTPVMLVYAPLTILSFAIEFHFFQFNPFIYHVNNLILHLGVSGLIFLFLLRIGFSMRVAFLSTLIFAVHPTRVESVAWITERKDVLYAFFYVGALHHYWSYLQSRRKRYFIFALMGGLLSILSKPMAWSLPLILLLCDWFYGRKMQKDVLWEKLAFVSYMFPIACITLLVTLNSAGHTLFQGVLLLSWSFSFYIQKFIFPVNLNTIYGIPQPVRYVNPAINYSLFVNLVFWGLVIYFRKHRKVLFGALFFVSTIFLVLKSHDVPGVNFVADRYMYMPALGLSIVVSYAIDRLLRFLRKHKFCFYTIYGLTVIGILFLCVSTYRLTQVWKSDLSLWSYVCRLSPDNPIAFANRGTAYHQMGQSDLALKDFNRALELDQEHVAAYNNRGVIYLERNNYESALNDLNRAVALKPDYTQAFFNRGRLYAQKNDYDAALKDFHKAIELNPYFMPAYMAKANLFISYHQYHKALEDYQKVLSFDPYNNKAFSMQAHILNHLQDFDALIDLYTQFIKTFPQNVKGYNLRGIAYTLKGEYGQAKKDFNHALKINPSNAEAYNNRGNIYFHLGDLKQAFEDFHTAIKYNPRYMEAYNNLGNMYLLKRQYAQAVDYYTQAINLNDQYPTFFYRRSWASAKLGDFQTALQDAHQAQALGLPGLEKYIKGLEKLMAIEDSGVVLQPMSLEGVSH